MRVIFIGTKRRKVASSCADFTFRASTRLDSEPHASMKFSTTSAFRAAASRTDAGVDVRLLELLFDHTPDIAFFIKDSAGRYLVVNDSLVERHGLSDKSQMIGRRPSDVCPGDF